ncbi:hypothetical protein ACRQ1B_14170 [Rhizobium panacihumi]|uniref:hypothetical protein n=1 Tax=Rhizobium panacihumi TaxID=2008450 RepID=UPI003D793D11
MMRRSAALSSKGRDVAKPRGGFLQINDKVKILAETLSLTACLCVCADVFYSLKAVFNHAIAPLCPSGGPCEKGNQKSVRGAAFINNTIAVHTLYGSPGSTMDG